MIEYKPREPRNKIIFPNAARTLLAIQQTGCDNLGVLLDFGHSLYGLETPADAAQLCIDAGKLFAIDVNDNFRGWDDDMVVGSVHLVETFEFFHTLRRNNWEGVWQLDQFPFREDSVQAAKQADHLPQGDPPGARRPGRGRPRRGPGQPRRAGRPAAGAEGAAQLDGRGGSDLMATLTAEHATMPVFGRLSPYASRDEQIAHIAEAARQIRIQDLKLVHYAGAGHIGGDFSAIDVLATLYGAVLNVTPETVEDPERDRFILSARATWPAPSTRRWPPSDSCPSRSWPPSSSPCPRSTATRTATRSAGSRPTPARSGHGLPIAVGHACRPSSTSPGDAPTSWSVTANCRRAATGRR